MTEKRITKEEYERLRSMSWEISHGELFYRTTAIRRYWRPAMAWLYFLIVALDFVIFPIIFIQLGKPEYKPITLQGGGLFHIAMSAIVAATAYGRSLEKMAQYRMDSWPGRGGFGGYEYSDPYQNPSMPYPGSPPVMMPHDNVGDAISNNEDEIIPQNPKMR